MLFYQGGQDLPSSSQSTKGAAIQARRNLPKVLRYKLVAIYQRCCDTSSSQSTKGAAIQARRNLPKVLRYKLVAIYQSCCDTSSSQSTMAAEQVYCPEWFRSARSPHLSTAEPLPAPEHSPPTETIWMLPGSPYSHSDFSDTRPKPV